LHLPAHQDGEYHQHDNYYHKTRTDTLCDGDSDSNDDGDDFDDDDDDNDNSDNEVNNDDNGDDSEDDDDEGLLSVSRSPFLLSSCHPVPHMSPAPYPVLESNSYGVRE
jgi:hypothetical protein